VLVPEVVLPHLGQVKAETSHTRDYNTPGRAAQHQIPSIDIRIKPGLNASLDVKRVFRKLRVSK
jgi:hypothetical protein